MLFRWFNFSRHYIAFGSSLSKFHFDLLSEFIELILYKHIDIAFFVGNLIDHSQITCFLISLSFIKTLQRPELPRWWYQIAIILGFFLKNWLRFYKHHSFVWLLNGLLYNDWLLLSLVKFIALPFARGTWGILLGANVSHDPTASVRAEWLDLVLSCASVGQSRQLVQSRWRLSHYFANTGLVWW